MVNRALGVYVLGIMLVQLVLLIRGIGPTSQSLSLVPFWSPVALAAATVAIGIGAIDLIRRGEANSTAGMVGLGILWTWIVAQFLTGG